METNPFWTTPRCTPTALHDAAPVGWAGQAIAPGQINIRYQTATRQEVFDRPTGKPHRQTDETNPVTKSQARRVDRRRIHPKPERIFEAMNRPAGSPGTFII